MTSREIIIQSKSGFHARPAAMFVRLASNFSSKIYIEKQNAKINGKSIMGIMMLALTKGSAIRIIADGPDEEEALKALIELVENDFPGEDLIS